VSTFLTAHQRNKAVQCQSRRYTLENIQDTRQIESAEYRTRKLCYRKDDRAMRAI